MTDQTIDHFAKLFTCLQISNDNSYFGIDLNFAHRTCQVGVSTDNSFFLDILPLG